MAEHIKVASSPVLAVSFFISKILGLCSRRIRRPEEIKYQGTERGCILESWFNFYQSDSESIGLL